MNDARRLLAIGAAVVLAVAFGVFGPSGGSAAGAGSSMSPLACTGILANGNPHNANGAGSTTCSSTTPQPLSHADQNGTGANPGNGFNPYAANGYGQVQGGHDAGSVGKADNKNPLGQWPNGTDHNRGYECDQNPGIGNGNPAHTTCGASVTPTTTASVTPTTTASVTPTTTASVTPTTTASVTPTTTASVTPTTTASVTPTTTASVTPTTTASVTPTTTASVTPTTTASVTPTTTVVPSGTTTVVPPGNNATPTTTAPTGGNTSVLPVNVSTGSPSVVSPSGASPAVVSPSGPTTGSPGSAIVTPATPGAAAAPTQLAFTGRRLDRLAALGLVLIAAGAALLYATRRRPMVMD